MALSNRFSNPYPQFFSLSLDFMAGGKLYFYNSATGALATTWPNNGRSGTGNPNPITLDSYGKPPVDIFMDPAVTYRVQLLASDGSTIWTADPYYDPLLQQQAKVPVYAGNPTGFVAGTAGSPGGSNSDVIYDYVNNLWYVATVTGNAATTVWTAIATSATSAIPAPQGRLTLTSGQPVLASEVTAATAVLYTPSSAGNLVPIYGSAAFVLYPFAELTLTLNATPHVSNGVYDVFAFLNSGVVTLCTGPAWSTVGTYYPGTGTTLTVSGAASRGTGAGTTQISRINGIYVNTVALSGKNGSTTYSIAANAATYLGTIWIDNTAAQVSCHMTFGQGRKFGVWNAYNRSTVILTGGDATASWSYNSVTLRAANATAANSVTALCGLAEEYVDSSYTTNMSSLSTNAAEAFCAVGYGVTNAASGRKGAINGTGTVSTGGTMIASYAAPPFLGLAALVGLEASNAASSSTILGTNANMEMRAAWRA